jgi:hypothetical protein
MKLHIILTTLILSFTSYAGPGAPGHSHAAPAIAKESTSAIGRYHVERLVKKGKIDKSWMNSEFEKTVKKTFGKRKEWVLTFTNSKGVKGKKLYIFLKMSGEFVAANFSGK